MSETAHAASLGTGCDHTEGCITCGDTAVPLQVLRVDSPRQLALCADDAGERETVDIGLVPEVLEGERVLVHAGTALSRLGDQAA